MTDREWMLTAPFIPPAKRGGRRRTTDMREAVNAMRYSAASGCAWRLLPKCFPPVSTVRRYFYAWRDCGLFDVRNRIFVHNLFSLRQAPPTICRRQPNLHRIYYDCDLQFGSEDAANPAITRRVLTIMLADEY